MEVKIEVHGKNRVNLRYELRHEFTISKMLYLKERRDGRAVECTGLENQQTFAGFQGSNPCLSANSFQLINSF